MYVVKLCKGAGDGIKTACLATAVGLINGEIGDRPSCLCPVIREFIITTNDLLPDYLREKYYGELPWELVGTNTDDKEIQSKRLIVFLDWSKKLLKYNAQHIGRVCMDNYHNYILCRLESMYYLGFFNEETFAQECVKCIREMIAVSPPAPKSGLMSRKKLSEMLA